MLSLVICVEAKEPGWRCAVMMRQEARSTISSSPGPILSRERTLEAWILSICRNARVPEAPELVLAPIGSRPPEAPLRHLPPGASFHCGFNLQWRRTGRQTDRHDRPGRISPHASPGHNTYCTRCTHCTRSTHCTQLRPSPRGCIAPVRLVVPPPTGSRAASYSRAPTLLSALHSALCPRPPRNRTTPSIRPHSATVTQSTTGNSSIGHSLPHHRSTTTERRLQRRRHPRPAHGLPLRNVVSDHHVHRSRPVLGPSVESALQDKGRRTALACLPSLASR